MNAQAKVNHAHAHAHYARVLREAKHDAEIIDEARNMLRDSDWIADAIVEGFERDELDCAADLLFPAGERDCAEFGRLLMPSIEEYIRKRAADRVLNRYCAECEYDADECCCPESTLSASERNGRPMMASEL